MNCKEFETLINDLARSPVMDVSRRDAAHSHAKDCARCDRRLAVEKQLTVGLRTLAILDENQKASANIEANLLSAFRKQAEVARQPIASTSSSLFASSRPLRSNRWWVAAAAVILLMLALVALRIQKTNPEEKVDQQQVIQKGPKQQEQPPNNKESNKQVLPDKPVPPPNPVPPAIGKGGNEKRTTPRKPSVKDLDKLNSRLAANTTTGNVATTPEQLTQNEIATPYISLMQGYMLPMSEGGQVVRVELPRSALASFGLPVNAERINERVKADVVVGNDGIARAIRFVR
jgi:hypothetical protein